MLSFDCGIFRRKVKEAKLEHSTSKMKTIITCQHGRRAVMWYLVCVSISHLIEYLMNIWTDFAETLIEFTCIQDLCFLVFLCFPSVWTCLSLYMSWLPHPSQLPCHFMSTSGNWDYCNHPCLCVLKPRSSSCSTSDYQTALLSRFSRCYFLCLVLTSIPRPCFWTNDSHLSSQPHRYLYYIWSLASDPCSGFWYHASHLIPEWSLPSSSLSTTDLLSHSWTTG